MDRRIWIGLSAAKSSRLFIVFILLTLAGGLTKASGQTVTNLYWFSGGDGSSPEFGLVQSHDGNFYGVTDSNRLLRPLRHGLQDQSHR